MILYHGISVYHIDSTGSRYLCVFLHSKFIKTQIEKMLWPTWFPASAARHHLPVISPLFSWLKPSHNPYNWWINPLKITNQSRKNHQNTQLLTVLTLILCGLVGQQSAFLNTAITNNLVRPGTKIHWVHGHGDFPAFDDAKPIKVIPLVIPKAHWIPLKSHE